VKKKGSYSLTHILKFTMNETFQIRRVQPVILVFLTKPVLNGLFLKNHLLNNILQCMYIRACEKKRNDDIDSVSFRLPFAKKMRKGHQSLPLWWTNLNSSSQLFFTVHFLFRTNKLKVIFIDHFVTWNRKVVLRISIFDPL